MQKILFAAIISLTILSCGRSKPPVAPDKANVTVHFSNVANNIPIVIGAAPSLVKEDGQLFSATVLKYYVCNLRITNTAGTETNLGNYTLIDADPATLKTDIKFPMLPNGTYSKITFNLGVVKSENDGSFTKEDVNPSTGMYWSWLGYTFLKHEGQFKNNAGNLQNVLNHYGANENYIPNVTINLNSMVVNGTDKKITVNFDLARFYKGIDFNVYSNFMADDTTTAPAYAVLRSNVPSSFSLGKVE